MERVPHLVCALWFFLLCTSTHVCMGCRNEERNALLSFKKSLYDESNVLSDWEGSNCCGWAGVGCSNKTGRVVKLSIGILASYSSITINHFDHSLSTLNYLQHLDLSYICFNSSTIPQFIGSLTHLSYLSLAYTDFVGTIPPNFGNLTSLRYLDLSFPAEHLHSDSLQWLSHLSVLQYLDLTGVNLTKAINWPLVFNKLPALSVLNLAGCGLSSFPIAASLPNANRSSIKSLELSMNSFSDASVIDWLLVNLKELEELDLSGNQLSGSIPNWIGEIRSLVILDLSDNLLNGSIPVSLLQHSELTALDLSSNSLQGIVSDAHLANLTKLKVLDLHSNSLRFNISPTWLPPFQLTNIGLGSCWLGPRFPLWLRTQKEISSIDISNAGISDIVPDWFWNVSSRADDLNISHNKIGGEVSTSLKLLSATSIDLSYNLFTGELPCLNSSLIKLYLSDNSFSGELQPILNEAMGSLEIVILARNHIIGKIPLSICQLKDLQVIDLSSNSLSGEIPNCLTHTCNRLRVICFASNNLSGSVPKWIGNLTFLMLLALSNNTFQGEIPSLGNCTEMIFLDLGENKFTGKIPTWIGESLPMLTILRLRSNMLTGHIPSQLSNLTYLQILDLSHNGLSGGIPHFLNNITAMTRPNKRTEVLIYNSPDGSAGSVSGNYLDDVTELDNSVGFLQSLVVVMKGSYLNYTTTLPLVFLLDLSCNRLSGEIPEELMELTELLSLNLSGNQLTGSIPDKIGNMVLLETLDLSRNQLSGAIPWSLTYLNLLSHLNLSYNNLSGAIPSGQQLQTLTDMSIYEGNPGLCGFPLPKTCGKPREVLKPEGNIDNHGMLELYLGIGLGFLVGLWSVYGIFLFKGSWRIAYFRFMDEMANKISVGMRVFSN